LFLRERVRHRGTQRTFPLERKREGQQKKTLNEFRIK